MTFLMKGRAVVVLLALMTVLVFLLAGCGGEPTAAPTEPAEPTEVSAATSPPTSAPTEPPAPTDTVTAPPPISTPTEEPTPVLVDDTACVNCHTDEETLQAVAEEPEETESLSEGEG